MSRSNVSKSQHEELRRHPRKVKSETQMAKSTSKANVKKQTRSTFDPKLLQMIIKTVNKRSSVADIFQKNIVKTALETRKIHVAHKMQKTKHQKVVEDIASNLGLAKVPEPTFQDEAEKLVNDLFSEMRKTKKKEEEPLYLSDTDSELDFDEEESDSDFDVLSVIEPESEPEMREKQPKKSLEKPKEKPKIIQLKKLSQRIVRTGKMASSQTVVKKKKSTRVSGLPFIKVTKANIYQEKTSSKESVSDKLTVKKFKRLSQRPLEIPALKRLQPFDDNQVESFKETERTIPKEHYLFKGKEVKKIDDLVSEIKGKAKPLELKQDLKSEKKEAIKYPEVKSKPDETKEIVKFNEAKDNLGLPTIEVKGGLSQSEKKKDLKHIKMKEDIEIQVKKEGIEVKKELKPLEKKQDLKSQKKDIMDIPQTKAMEVKEGLAPKVKSDLAVDKEKEPIYVKVDSKPSEKKWGLESPDMKINLKAFDEPKISVEMEHDLKPPDEKKDLKLKKVITLEKPKIFSLKYSEMKERLKPPNMISSEIKWNFKPPEMKSNLQEIQRKRNVKYSKIRRDKKSAASEIKSVSSTMYFKFSDVIDQLKASQSNFTLASYEKISYYKPSKEHSRKKDIVGTSLEPFTGLKSVLVSPSKIKGKPEKNLYAYEQLPLKRFHEKKDVPDGMSSKIDMTSGKLFPDLDLSAHAIKKAQKDSRYKDNVQDETKKYLMRQVEQMLDSLAFGQRYINGDLENDFNRRRTEVKSIDFLWKNYLDIINEDDIGRESTKEKKRQTRNSILKDIENNLMRYTVHGKILDVLTGKKWHSYVKQKEMKFLQVKALTIDDETMKLKDKSLKNTLRILKEHIKKIITPPEVRIEEQRRQSLIKAFFLAKADQEKKSRKISEIKETTMDDILHMRGFRGPVKKNRGNIIWIKKPEFIDFLKPMKRKEKEFYDLHKEIYYTKGYSGKKELTVEKKPQDKFDDNRVRVERSPSTDYGEALFRHMPKISEKPPSPINKVSRGFVKYFGLLKG